jgi:hypothetical protein
VVIQLVSEAIEVFLTPCEPDLDLQQLNGAPSHPGDQQGREQSKQNR